MNLEQQQSILTIALFAAFADGDKHERERDEIRRIAESLGGNAETPDLSKIYQAVLLKRVSLSQAIGALHESAHRQLAYEMAVCICDADGRQSENEQRFLGELKSLLQLDAKQTLAFENDAEAMVALGETAAPAAAPVPPVSPVPPTAPAAVHTTTETPSINPALASAPAVAMQVDEAKLDKAILNYSIMNGALELLPQSWASMAIIPLQIKMIYGIGKAHGVSLDQGHIKEFIAAAGVGLTSQYLEQFGRKLLGGLLGAMAGKAVGKVGRAATGMAFSFATTYALGQLAKRYYAGGRVMNTALLKATFDDLLTPAKQMQSQYLPQIQQQASTLNMSTVMDMVRGK